MQSITKIDLKRMNEQEHEDFVLINVLDAGAFNKQHIRTSINIPVSRDDFSDLVALVSADKARKVVVYCASFDCDASLNAARKLEEDGFKRVYDYEGGSADWFEIRKSA